MRGWAAWQGPLLRYILGLSQAYLGPISAPGRRSQSTASARAAWPPRRAGPACAPGIARVLGAHQHARRRAHVIVESRGGVAPHL
eukprot:scaffold16177_cov46-Phaeocystis_antarctica.AAC.1